MANACEKAILRVGTSGFILETGCVTVQRTGSEK